MGLRSFVGRSLVWLAQKTASADELHRILVHGAGGGPSASGEIVTPATAMRCATVHACVRVLSEDVGKLPLILYRRTKDGGKERATDHPLYKILRNKPNAWQTSIGFIGMGQAHLELRGNAYAYITRVNGKVRELLPLRADRVEVTQADDWSLQYKVKLTSSGASEPVKASDILHVTGLSLDGVTGISTISYAREAIGLALATEKHGGRLFKNGARPSVILSRPKELKALSEEAARRFVESFNERHGGEHGGGTALLEEGITATPVTMSSEDAQFLETRQYQRTEICGLFRVPPHKISDTSRSTFNNIEQQSLDYLGDALLPRLVRWEQALNAALLTPTEQDEYFVEFLVDSLLRADFKTRMDGYNVAVNSGIMSPNEARAKENLNPRPGGDEYLRPMNMTPSSKPTPTPSNANDPPEDS